MRRARDVARTVLRRVGQGEAYATLALAGELRDADPSERALATELVYGVLRHRTRLDRALAQFAPRGVDKLSAPVLTALRIAAYQILATRVPAHAAVDDAVGAIRVTTGGEKVAGFANAVLRKLAREGEPPPPAKLAARLEQVHSFPPWLARRLTTAVGEEHVEEAAAAFNRPAPTVFRVTGDRDVVSARILAERPDAVLAPSAYVAEALVARNTGAPETLSAFLDGSCTVQDTAAQLVTQLLDPQPGEHILDACAGVGGKSTHLAQRGARVDAADSSRRKLDLAEDTARRLRVTGVRTIVADLTQSEAPLAASYDRVLLDAPCSGLGVLRRHPEAKWREADIAGVAALQRRILTAVAPRVRPGGVLVYSVCTFTEEEGVKQIEAFLAAHPDFTLVPAPQLADARGHLRTWPHLHDADAFFAVRLQRRA